MSQHVLIVEDDYAISEVLKAYLKKAGFLVSQAYDGTEGIKRFKEMTPSIVILDVMLPYKNGWDVLKEIRIASTVPVIMLTALGDIDDKLTGLNGGADDYIEKPFEAEEVLARIQAVLRRSGVKDADRVTFGQLSIDFKAHHVMLNRQPVVLTPRDLAVLLFLAEHPNQTFTRDQLIDAVWGYDYDGSDRAVDLAIKRIRKALGPWPQSEGEIKTLRGLGYQLYVKNE
ncbi:DNA-binding response regulator [Halolactibacillus miurensis]|uniref:DNA-binding response regulator n=1 Tax=Halolactibacillus miurensis TaxID=306541 RepID=A0A1I6P8U7_9BACI|nr:response regulator transcription factor [Halolactibacillus miurensis]GEM03047.1 DNA-binding response regulator [Halolactibacillus miurensis]SFS36599.1 DNA-binding response regulator, OmpR family, contains REC and winged-helix (wHTH) domain [Halolactibacillus miurensis]